MYKVIVTEQWRSIIDNVKEIHRKVINHEDYSDAKSTFDLMLHMAINRLLRGYKIEIELRDSDEIIHKYIINNDKP